MVVVPVARHYLRHFFRLIRMVKVRERVVPRIEHQGHGEERDTPDAQPEQWLRTSPTHRSVARS